MKKVKGGKSRAVHPVSEYVPAGIMNLADALSPDDKQILSYLISFTPSSSIHNHIKNTTITTTTTKQDQVKQQHMPVFNCDCFSCYTSYWSRWNISPNRLLIHDIIDAYEDHLASSSANKKSCGGGSREIRANKKKKKKKRTRRVVVSPSDSEFIRSDSMVADNKNHDLSVIVYRDSDGVSVEEDLDDDIDDIDDDDEKGVGGSNIMNKFVTFIANKLWN